MSQENSPKGTAVVSKGPSVMRYDRVQTILEAEPAFRDRLGPKDQEVMKRNGQPQRFAKSVIEVTRRLHVNGIDAHTANKPLVLRLADEVLSSLKSGGSAPKRPTEPKPAAEPKPAKVKSIKAAKPATEPEKPVASRKRVKPEPAPSPAAPETATVIPAQVAPAETASGGNQQVTTTYIFLSVLTLLHSAYNLLQTFDREPGAEKRQEKLADQMEEVYRLRDVPVPVPVNTIPPTLKNGQLSDAKG